MINLQRLALLAVISSVILVGCDSPEALIGGSLLTLSLVGIAALVLIIIAIIDLIKRPMPIVNKAVWALVIWVLPFVGAIIYLAIGRK